MFFRRKTFWELYEETGKKGNLTWEMSRHLGRLSKMASANNEIIELLKHCKVNLSGKQKKLLVSKVDEKGSLTPADYLVLWDTTRDKKWLRVDPGDNFQLAMLMAIYFHKANGSDWQYWNSGIQNAIRIVTTKDASLNDLCGVYRLKMNPKIWDRIKKKTESFEDWLFVTRECPQSFAAYVNCLKTVTTEEQLDQIPDRNEKIFRRSFCVAASHLYERLALE